jgi:hypothetical protein
MERYPGVKTILDITSHLELEGWKVLNYDPLNPELKSPTLHSWTRFQDTSHGHGELVDQWMSWYEDRRGNRLLVAFQYRKLFDSRWNSNMFSVLLHHEPSTDEVGADR